jgi:uncharacterized membrane protein
MHLLDTFTITLTGLMVGNELAVSAFFNPAVRQLESGPQAKGLSLLARSLGGLMPVWYGVCLALLVLESFLHRDRAALAPLLVAASIWAFVIVATILILVPINNRVAALDPAAPAPGWQKDHAKWDSLHRVRIVLLTIAAVALNYALVA